MADIAVRVLLLAPRWQVLEQSNPGHLHTHALVALLSIRCYVEGWGQALHLTFARLEYA